MTKPPYELLSLISDHMADSTILVHALGERAPAKLVMSDKRLKAAVYSIAYDAAEILTTMRALYPDVVDRDLQS